MTAARTASRTTRRATRQPLGLTLRQNELLGFIRSYSADKGGVSPTFDEMKDHLRLSSKSGISRMVAAMEERGAIRRLKNRARAIVVVEVAHG
ncbi:LexA family protein [Ensifer sp. 4252]|uniref:LexA family protein n=1 Tax=Ensifer sp. 4252 TaxID=3373915 RepID=UPI003D1AF8FD